jgi:uncharacterized cupin superfamily protein
MPRLDPDKIMTESGSDELGSFHAALLSDTGGLTQFGAFIETLSAGSKSSRPHWHRSEDELIYMLSGSVVLIESDIQTTLTTGDTATFKAGSEIGHCLMNVSAIDARYLVIGTRSGDDVVTYTDNGDTVTIKNGTQTYRDVSGTVTKTAPYHGA